jgi:hypothetical protein
MSAPTSGPRPLPDLFPPAIIRLLNEAQTSDELQHYSKVLLAVEFEDSAANNIMQAYEKAWQRCVRRPYFDNQYFAITTHYLHAKIEASMGDRRLLDETLGGLGEDSEQ